MTPDRAEPSISDADAVLLQDGAALVTTNPFEERWLILQKRILGRAYQDLGRVLAMRGDPRIPNLGRLIEALRPVHARLRRRLRAGAAVAPEARDAYVAVGLLFLYAGFEAELLDVARTGIAAGDLLTRFHANHAAMFTLPGAPLDAPAPRVMLEVCYQARRAFEAVHTGLRGVSPEAGKLRARVWNARFPGGDLLRYARGGQARQDGVHTLILGDTGTGKELVARALAYSRHLPYSEAHRAFTVRPTEGFHVVNTSGLAANLVDSLLFGHVKGAFTGADRDAPGVLAKCAPGQVLFLDEFGDLAPEVQIKLLRVVEERKYTPVGATEERALGGSLLFAAQPALFRGRGFRQDMRHRLHEHVIRLPSLRARLDSDPAELPFLVRLFATKVAGAADAERLTGEVLRIVETKLQGYRWAGNVRELRGCVSNVYEQREYEPPSGYEPPSAGAPAGAPSTKLAPSSRPAALVAKAPESGADLARAVLEGTISMADLKQRYIAHTHAQTGSYTETAKRLGIDWRTVRSAVEVERAARRAETSPDAAAPAPPRASEMGVR